MEKKFILIDGELCPLDSESTLTFSKNSNGLVPAPNTDEELYLKSDGTWSAIENGNIDSISTEDIQNYFN